MDDLEFCTNPGNSIIMPREQKPLSTQLKVFVLSKLPFLVWLPTYNFSKLQVRVVCSPSTNTFSSDVVVTRRVLW
jgi:hypothetical protein